VRYGVEFSIACLALYTLVMAGVRVYAHNIGVVGGLLVEVMLSPQPLRRRGVIAGEPALHFAMKFCDGLPEHLGARRVFAAPERHAA